MVLAYCILDISSPGGTERTLLVQANYFAEHGNEVHIITTEDVLNGHPFYEYSDKIHFHCLHINYRSVDGKISPSAIISRIRLGNKHRKALTSLLNQLRPDFTFTMFGHELSFLYKIKDGSRKISQFHFSKNYRLIESRYSSMSLLGKIFMVLKDWRKRLFLKHYDAFVVLTEEDAMEWGNIPNLHVISNAVPFKTESVAACDNKIVISVGRLVYQKGYDMLVDVWNLVNKRHPDWKLLVFGSGPESDLLESKISSYGLTDSFIIKKPVSDIVSEYLKASIYVSSSRYEGLPMTLLEAMSCGLPCVSFSCPCGPSEIISNGEDGFVVPVGDVESMADKICLLIEDADTRKNFGRSARQNMEYYSVDSVMGRWKELLNSLSR